MAVDSSYVNAERPFQAIVFDLFGTLVDMDGSTLPRVEIDGESRVMSIQGLPELLAELPMPADVGGFLSVLVEVSREFEEHRVRTDTEWTSPRRFRLALERYGAGDYAGPLAVEMTLRHMRSLASCVRCPPQRLAVLRGLAEHYRLGLVSNFDYGPTARGVLAEAGLAEFFQATVISDELGLRKPNAAIFARACALLGVETGSCLYVGDSHRADVEGATGAGMTALWIHAGTDKTDNVDEAGTAQGQAAAPARIADVAELPQWLEGLGG